MKPFDWWDRFVHTVFPTKKKRFLPPTHTPKQLAQKQEKEGTNETSRSLVIIGHSNRPRTDCNMAKTSPSSGLVLPQSWDESWRVSCLRSSFPPPHLTSPHLTAFVRLHMVGDASEGSNLTMLDPDLRSNRLRVERTCSFFDRGLR